MKTAPQYEFTEQQKKILLLATKLEWVSLFYLFSVVVLMYFALGQSQAMKTVWIDDLLSMIPPLIFILGNKICWRKPSKHYPYGFHRIISIFFLCAALALLTLGGFYFIESLYKLIRQEHPTIGLINIFGFDIWLGWMMLLVLLWSLVPPIFLGRKKLKLADKINDQVLYTDAIMNKADWLTASVTMVGVIGIGFGIWWFDSLAASIVAADIAYDGIKQTKEAFTSLINRAPMNLKGEYIELPDQVILALKEFPWINKSEVRLYEQGHLIFGEGFISVKEKCVSTQQIQEATKKIQNMDWRLKSFIITLSEEV